ncbi:hypothetical protein QBC32DRAFT_164813 [Pseudoneurospora amorphoporcata]|uniref:Secreted protein n=1 Tax=Pseudoneurospora amorphoporcata TaxID=241081 RepID=A0AAN6SJ14_9PEZI|nr:hypothetical protein QBC32DRAFT_164813 [Pseudoneurospora amorphoporcata]
MEGTYSFLLLLSPLPLWQSDFNQRLPMGRNIGKSDSQPETTSSGCLSTCPMQQSTKNPRQARIVQKSARAIRSHKCLQLGSHQGMRMQGSLFPEVCEHHAGLGPSCIPQRHGTGGNVIC